MEYALIATSCLLIGWFLGYYPNRKDYNDAHYQDMKTMVNQFASLSTQMFNINKNQSPEPVMMPMPEEFESDSSPQGGEEEDEVALMGGRM